VSFGTSRPASNIEDEQKLKQSISNYLIRSSAYRSFT